MNTPAELRALALADRLDDAWLGLDALLARDELRADR